MRFITFSLLALISVPAFAQTDPVPKPDGITYPHAGAPVPCGGSSNPQGVDLNWKPILTLKVEEAEHPVPDQAYLDSVKAVKLNIKLNTHSFPAEKTTFITPQVGPNFSGNNHNGMTPLDNSVAIANNGNIVSVANHTIGCYDAWGTNHYYSSIESFLPSSFGVSQVCDPVVIYDQSADRFVFFCQEYSTSFTLFSNNRIFISFSKSNNPAADGWWCYAIQGDPTTNGDAFDYPKLAVNDSELYITGNLFYEPANTFDQAVLYQMYKYPGYTGTTLNYLYYVGINNSPFTVLPVSYGQTGSYGAGIYAVATHASGSSSINLYKVTKSMCCNPVLNHWSVSTTSYSAPGNASQLGTSCYLNTGDCRSLSGFWLNNNIHFVFNCDGGSGYTSINYNRLNTSLLSNTSSTFGLTGYDYVYPSVASFATSSTDKSVMIGFARSGSSIYPEMRVVECDDAMSWSGSVLVYPGANYIDCSGGSSVTRWGDYSGNSRRHNTPTPSVWISGSYADATSAWETWIAEINAPGASVKNVSNPGSDARVYPNPVSESFSVTFSLEANTTQLSITIYDVNGRIVKELYKGKAHSGENEFSFNKANLVPGGYMLAIQNDNAVIKEEKIVITK